MFSRGSDPEEVFLEGLIRFILQVRIRVKSIRNCNTGAKYKVWCFACRKKERFREERDRKRVLTPLMVQNFQYGVLPAEKEIERNEVQRKERGSGEKKERKREEGERRRE